MPDPIVGTWDVFYVQGNVLRYRYVYTCSEQHTVRWYDFNDPTENGGGTWSRAGDQISFNWKDSATSESWAVDAGGQKASGQVVASYGTFTVGASRTDKGDDTRNDLMQQWSDAIDAGEPFGHPGTCPLAIPYLQRKPASAKPLNPKFTTRPIQKVRGLAIHTTWGSAGSVSPEWTVSACLNTWNAAGVPTSAHFALAADGTLLQFVPLDRCAFAQGGNADLWYLSVEVETKNSAASGPQIETARKLFRWVVGRYGVTPGLATGYVGPHGDGQWAASAKADYDPITREICQKTTTDKAEAAGSSGLSCHYWLHPVKPCPGKPLLKQLPDIAEP
jgi:hypothetical protein